MASGSVRWRSPGTWELRWDAGRGDGGERQQRSKTFIGTKKAAEGELNRILADLNLTSAEKGSRLSLAECCSQYFEERAGSPLRRCKKG